jgi:hypothetical protein
VIIRRHVPLRAMLACLLFAAFAVVARGDHPPAPELFPKDTAALVRVANAPELIAKFQNTALGRMVKDDKIAPLFAELYGSATEMFEQVKDQFGVGLTEMLEIPQGEIAFGVVASEGTRPSFMLILDAGDRADSASKLLDKAIEALEKQGQAKSEEKIDDLKITVFTFPGDRTKLYLFQKDNTFVAVTDLDVAKKLLVNWTAPAGKSGADTLAKNERYNAIMKRCRGAKDNPPQITFFADPLAIAKSAAVGDFTATATLAILPSLGLDGFSGVGGSMTLDAGDYDSIAHFHVLLENPRVGALKALALTSGDLTPPKWVPDDVSNYQCVYWDFGTTYTQIAKLVDTFRGEGSTDRTVQGFFDAQLDGLKFKEDVLDQFAGRIIHTSMIEFPAKAEMPSQCAVFQLKDAAAFQTNLAKIMAKFKDSWEELKVGNQVYYKAKFEGPRQRRRRARQQDQGQQPDAPPQAAVAAPAPCLAVVDDNLFISSESILKKIILAKSDPNAKSLADSPEYKLVADRYEHVAAGLKPGMISYDQPEYGMRWMYELATNDEAKQFLENPDAPEPIKKLHAALNNHPLPPFEVIQQYLSPTGGVLVNEPTGFHYTMFSIRRAPPSGAK